MSKSVRCPWFHIESHGIRSIVVGHAESHPHDKQVLVVVSEDGVSVAHIVEVIALESA